MTTTAPDRQPSTPGDLREDIAYLVFRAVDIGDPSRAAALEVADQILARLAESGRPSTPGQALRWAADRWRSEAIGHNEWDTPTALRRWADELDAAPTVYSLPAEPPEHVTELWDRDGQVWLRTAPRTWGRADELNDPWWLRWTWLRLLDKRGPLSTVPPERTEGGDA